MSTDIEKRSEASLVEKVLIAGDLSVLTADQRMDYYLKVCESVGLNPLTKPFDYLMMKDGKDKMKMILYANRGCTDQLRAVKGVSVEIVSRDLFGDVYVVTARASIAGRTDESTGAVSVRGLYGDGLANKYMTAETKAKRRVTLSICGLGLLDESEVSTIPGAERADVDTTTGEIRPVARMTSHQAANAGTTGDQAVEALTGATTSQGPAPTSHPREHNEPATTSSAPSSNGNQSPYQTDPGDTRDISTPQVRRFMAIASKNGWNEAGWRALIEEYGFQHPDKIQRNVYQEICDKLESEDSRSIYNGEGDDGEKWANETFGTHGQDVSTQGAST